MLNLMENYINILIHPVQGHQKLAKHRDQLEQMRKNRDFEIVNESHREDQKLEFANFALLSWPFVILSAIYSISFMLIGIKLADSSYFQTLDLLPGFSAGSLFKQKMFLITVLFQVVLFPLVAWFYVKFWRVIISFFGSLFDKNIDPKSLDNVVNSSLVGNTFLVIPVIGKIFKSLSQAYLVFLGVRHNLRFSLTQSLIVVISPLIAIGMFLLFLLMYIMFIINMLQ